MIADMRTDEGLRDALVRIPDEGGWDGPLGRLVVNALVQEAHRWQARGSDVTDPHRHTHLVGLAWEFVATNTAAVVKARSPWGLLRTTMRHLAVEAALADDLVTSERHASQFTRARTRRGLKTPVRTATRVDVQADGAAVLDVSSARPAAADPVGDEALSRVEPEAGTEGWDDALRVLYEELIAAGAPRRETAEAINGVIDAVASAESRSRMHTAVYQAAQLDGLSHAQRRALVNLLIGSRRGGAESSAWLLLRRRLADGRQPEASLTVRDDRRLVQFAAPFRTRRGRSLALALAS